MNVPNRTAQRRRRAPGCLASGVILAFASGEAWQSAAQEGAPPSTAASIEFKRPAPPAKKPAAAIPRKPAAQSPRVANKAAKGIAKAPPKILPRKSGFTPFAENIEALLDGADAATSARIGIHVIDLTTGKEIYERDSTKLFAPASTTKLFTTALALSRLGPEYRFVTRVTAATYPNANGVLASDLVFEGGGDPSLSERAYPYRVEQGSARSPIEEFADQVAARGVTRIEGDVVGDDTLYPWHPYPPGWTIDDSVADYGAPVSALSVYDNMIRVGVRPGARPGDLAQISVSPGLEYYAIDNRVETVSGAGSFRLTRAPGSRQLLLWGTISARNGVAVESIAVDDPALYAAQALYEALTRRGISIGGSALARHRVANEERLPFDGVVLARRESPPLAELLQVVDKVSQNLHAEIMLREVGRARRGAGTRTAGLEELRAFLAQQGIPAADYDFKDGSGLSRLTMTTPAAETTLLSKMYASRYRDTWVNLLPIAGVDGTLRRRFQSEKLPVYAKTGSLSHVVALAGYASHPSGMRAFSILVNQANAPAAEVRALIDKIVIALLAE